MYSKEWSYVLIAFALGYRAISGRIQSPFGGYRTINKSAINCRPRFTIRNPASGKNISVRVHKLVAYQKFGPKVFTPGLQVRHLDSNPDNFCDENIALGTPSENAMDMDPRLRLRKSITASTALRRFSDLAIEGMRLEYAKGATYIDLMRKYHISSKGTISYMLNARYVTHL
jgi:hypothetical protein